MTRGATHARPYTAGCSVVEPWAALLAGAGGALTIWASGKAILKLRIDDPLEAFPMHGRGLHSSIS
jgi:Amt family ammonium transporter